MALDKAVQFQKERRKPYRKSKAVDRTCRNHGGCGWCEGNRLNRDVRNLQEMLEEIEMFENGENK